MGNWWDNLDRHLYSAKNWGRASPICAVFDSLVLDLKKESYTFYKKKYFFSGSKVDFCKVISHKLQLFMRKQLLKLRQISPRPDSTVLSIYQTIFLINIYWFPALTLLFPLFLQETTQSQDLKWYSNAECLITWLHTTFQVLSLS